MNCIDAVEGVVQSILRNHLDRTVKDRIDETEFIRWVKIVLEATDGYVRENPEITENPDTLRDVLYQHAKTLWLSHLKTVLNRGPQAEAPLTTELDEEYQEYCFDHIFKHGTHPL